MADLKQKVQGIDPNLTAMDLQEISHKSEDNIYEALAIIGKRARNLVTDLKIELHGKLEEFAVSYDAIEEVMENKEQLEISKFYERLANPALIALNEFKEDKLEWEYRSTDPEI